VEQKEKYRKSIQSKIKIVCQPPVRITLNTVLYILLEFVCIHVYSFLTKTEFLLCRYFLSCLLHSYIIFFTINILDVLLLNIPALTFSGCSPVHRYKYSYRVIAHSPESPVLEGVSHHRRTPTANSQGLSPGGAETRL
jgi:hypothetical protein